MTVSAPEPIGPEHDVSGFSCGKPSLDHWLQARALTNHQRGFTVVMVVHEDNRVVGYYGLAPTATVPISLPRSIRTGQPPNPVPCLLLGQLAVDQSFASRGIATGLIRHAFARCIAGAELVGGRALMVHAVDNEAAAFWKRWDFLPSKDNPLVLFRSIPEIAASLAE